MHDLSVVCFFCCISEAIYVRAVLVSEQANGGKRQRVKERENVRTRKQKQQNIAPSMQKKKENISLTHSPIPIVIECYSIG